MQYVQRRWRVHVALAEVVMDWAPEALQLVERVNANIPSFVRGMVARVVRKESERLAAAARAQRVEPAHVEAAYLARTPAPMRPLLEKALGRRGAQGDADEPHFAVGESMNPGEIAEFLAWEGTGRLGVVDAEGRPYVVPLSFVFDGGCVYYHWFSEEGRKTRAIARNRKVCFEADWATRDQLSYRSVIGDGVIDEIADVSERARILELLAEKFPAYATGAGHSADVAEIIQRGNEAMAEAVRIFRIQFERITGKKKGAGPPR